MVAALHLDQRVERAAQALGYLAINVPIALLGLLAVIGLMLGAALSVLGIGLPILLGAAATCRWLLGGDRWAANRLLDAHIQSLPPAPRTSGTPWRRSLQVLSDRALWRVVAALAAKPLLIAGVLVMALAPVVLLAFIGGLGVQGVIGAGDLDYFGPWTFGVWTGLVLCLFALPAAVLAIATLDAMRTLLCTITRALLGPRTAASGPVREILADSIGDRSVSVAYWLPDREVFVDEGGRPVDLPDPGSGRTWTAVERDGRRVAAIMHDAALDTSRELVQAAADASSLAIDNERLKADLRARLEELRVSRLRIVEASDAARRRIERDLHDGAQQQLVSLSLDLQLIERRVDDEETRRRLAESRAKLGDALAELRELARGIHPALLTHRGLPPALDALAQRSPVPVELAVELSRRPPASVEAAIYFLVSEALANVAKYAAADEVRVVVDGDESVVTVVVEDDGVGGADPAHGSGLRGLSDRIAALDGRLQIDSGPEGGTRLTATIPLGSADAEDGR